MELLVSKGSEDSLTAEFDAPYLIYLGDVKESSQAKTALGLRDWARDRCLAQYRRLPETLSIGLPDMTFEAAVAAGCRSLVIGLAPIGGQIPKAWQGDIVAALKAGLDIVSGMHTRLKDIAEIANLAKMKCRRLIDVRQPQRAYPVGTGRKRTGRRLLTVGTDCALGKKYTALSITRELQQRGLKATFRATGQTGIMLAGTGIPIDSIVSDFIAGASEVLSPDNEIDHWDVIEGQGSLFHPAYAAVSLGLLHGSQPDAIVMCHDPSRRHIQGYPDFPLPDLKDAIALTLSMGRLTNPTIRCIGVSLNTSHIDAEKRSQLISETADYLGLPCVDPIAMGVTPIVDSMGLP